MARSRKGADTLGAKDTFHVLGLAEDVVKGAAPHALNVAQHRAERAGEPVTLTVVRRSLFGPEAPLYKVVRDQDGNVLTFTLDPQD